MARTIHIGLTGGSSGGHAYPLLAVLEALEDALRGGERLAKFHYFGERNTYVADILEQVQYFHSVAAGKVRRYVTLGYLIDGPKIIWSFFQAFWKMYFAMPDVLFSKGGPGAFPVVLAAWFFRVPVVLHESDTDPGLTNLASSFFVRRAAVSFPQAVRFFGGNKAVLTGTPVRHALLARRTEPGEAKSRLGFDPDKPLLLVIGGSQGAKRLNEFLIPILKDLLPVTQILHQTGSANFMDAQKLVTAELLEVPTAVAAASRYKALPYLDLPTLAAALSAADLVVGRAGSASIFESAAFGKPMVLIPIPRAIAGAQQEENAYAVREAGFAKVVEEDNLSEGIFLAELKGVLENPDAARAMAEAAAKFYKPDAAQNIASEVLALVH